MKNDARQVDVAAVIGEAQLGRMQILVLTLCALAAILDGFDLQAIAFTGPVIAQEWGIEATALGVVFSAALAGMTFGALLVGMLGDRFGRKVAVGLSVAIFGLFTLAIVSANSYTELLVYRFLVGLGVGHCPSWRYCWSGVGRCPSRFGFGYSGLLSYFWPGADDRCYRRCSDSV
jgi:MFS family permease